ARERDAGNAKSGRVAGPVTRVAKRGRHGVEVAAGHDAVARGSDDQENGSGDPATAGEPHALENRCAALGKTIEPAGRPVRNGRARAPAWLAEHTAALGLLGGRRCAVQRLSEASSTIHRTSSSNVMPA